MSVKFQITLPEDLAAEMKATAAAQGVPLAQLIRETMEQGLRAVKWARSEDPFAWMDGLATTEETDLASRVDEILYRDASIH